MYCPAPFEEKRPELLLELISQYPLATIISHGSSGLVADHIPLLHLPVPGSLGRLVGHVARNNPLWQASSKQEHLLVFQGPSTYISPNWYASKQEAGKVVPTWSYAVVHVYASLTAIQQPAEILALLKQLTRQHEATQPHPWQVEDAPVEYTERLLDHIVGVEFAIERLQGKWKVSQNQPPMNQQSVITGLLTVGSETADDMASLVKQSLSERIK